MVIDRDKNSITLTVPKDQLSLLIGKKGRNIRLASKLLGWELIAEAEEVASGILIADIAGISAKMKEALREAGYDTADKAAKASIEELSEVSGVGPKSAEKIRARAKEAVDEVKAELKKEEEIKEAERAAKKFFSSAGEDKKTEQNVEEAAALAAPEEESEKPEEEPEETEEEPEKPEETEEEPEKPEEEK